MGTGTGVFVRARSPRAWRVVVAVAALALVVAALAVAQRTPTGTGAAGSGHGDHGPALSPADRRAVLAQPVAVRGSEFKAECRGSHVGGDDPIVKFNQPGASHLHQFIRNASTNAVSTVDSLRAAGTNCAPASDKSPYWVPALYRNGVLVPPETVTIYYQGLYLNGKTATAYPPGLKMVVGKAAAATPDDNPSARWNCVPGGASSRDFMNCPTRYQIAGVFEFPHLLERPRPGQRRPHQPHGVRARRHVLSRHPPGGRGSAPVRHHVSGERHRPDPGRDPQRRQCHQRARLDLPR